MLSEKLFWIAAGERALKTFAQSLVALFAAGVTILNIDWQQGLAVAATAAVVTVVEVAATVAAVTLKASLGPQAVHQSPHLLKEPHHLAPVAVKAYSQA